jgi:hypothetical protein
LIFLLYAIQPLLQLLDTVWTRRRPTNSDVPFPKADGRTTTRSLRSQPTTLAYPCPWIYRTGS